MGQEVRTLVSAFRFAGSYQVVWDGTSTLGEQVSAGVYLYKLQIGRPSETRMMTLTRNE